MAVSKTIKRQNNPKIIPKVAWVRIS